MSLSCTYKNVNIYQGQSAHIKYVVPFLSSCSNCYALEGENVRVNKRNCSLFQPFLECVNTIVIRCNFEVFVLKQPWNISKTHVNLSNVHRSSKALAISLFEIKTRGDYTFAKLWNYLAKFYQKLILKITLQKANILSGPFHFCVHYMELCICCSDGKITASR